VTAGVSVFALIVSFATTTYLQSQRIAAERERVAEQRERAERERERAEEISMFLVNLFKLSDPEENRGNKITARELLDSGAKRLQSALQDQPTTKAALLETVAAVYDSLGQYQEALPILQQSLTLQSSSRDRTRIDTLLEQGRALSGTGDLRGAEAPLEEGLHLSQAEFGATSRESGRAMWELGGCGISKANSATRRDYIYVASISWRTRKLHPPTYPRCWMISRRFMRGSSSGHWQNKPMSGHWMSIGASSARIIHV
jgi:tetratricopeptide (TPR) repeat protein